MTLLMFLMGNKCWKLQKYQKIIVYRLSMALIKKWSLIYGRFIVPEVTLELNMTKIIQSHLEIMFLAFKMLF